MLLTGKKVKGKKGTAKKNHLQQPLAAAYFPSNTFNLFLQGMFLHSKRILRHIFNQIFYSKYLNSAHGQWFSDCYSSHSIVLLLCVSVCVTILIAAGEVLGDVFEVSRIRREDYEFHKGKSEYEDILQCNNLPSSATPRGHQTPAAFLIMASGLDKVGTYCQNNLCKLIKSFLYLLFFSPNSNTARRGLYSTTAIFPHWHCWVQWSFSRCPNRSPGHHHGN